MAAVAPAYVEFPGSLCQPVGPFALRDIRTPEDDIDGKKVGAERCGDHCNGKEEELHNY